MLVGPSNTATTYLAWQQHAHPDGQAKAAVLVDQVQELEAPAISGHVELEIHVPHLVGILSPVASHRSVCGACPLSPPGSRPLQAFLAPEPLHVFVILAPALSDEQAGLNQSTSIGWLLAGVSPVLAVPRCRASRLAVPPGLRRNHPGAASSLPRLR